MTRCLDTCPTCEGSFDERDAMDKFYWTYIMITADQLPQDTSWRTIDQLALFKQSNDIAEDVECSLKEALDIAVDPSQYPCTCGMDLVNDRVIPHPHIPEPCAEECPW